MTGHVDRTYEVDDAAQIMIEGFTGPDGPVTVDEPETRRRGQDLAQPEWPAPA